MAKAEPNGDASARAELGLFDFTLLVVGAIVGADVYVVAAMGSAQLGPAQIIAWLAAGLIERACAGAVDNAGEVAVAIRLERDFAAVDDDGERFERRRPDAKVHAAVDDFGAHGVAALHLALSRAN